MPNTSFDDEAYWNPDPYKTCEKFCNHDLARTILISDLLGPFDGPHPLNPLHARWGMMPGAIAAATAAAAAAAETAAQSPN